MPKNAKKPTTKRLKIDRAKIRPLSPSTNHFLSLASSVIYQQISTSAGDAIYGRFIKLFGKKKPVPKTLLTFTDATLRTAGLSGQKVKYLRDLAEKFLDGTINPKLFPAMTDAEIKEHLLQVKGIGPWTADMFLIFALNRKDVLPVGDLAIKKGFQKAFGLRKMPNDKQMIQLAAAHKGEWTELSLHLWFILEGK